MKDYPNQLSRAVVLFFGADGPRHRSPSGERFVAEFGERSVELEREVRRVWEEAMSVTVDWSKHSLASGGILVAAELRRRYPGLSDAAIEALVNRFTFEWR